MQQVEQKLEHPYLDPAPIPFKPFISCAKRLLADNLGLKVAKEPLTADLYDSQNQQILLDNADFRKRLKLTRQDILNSRFRDGYLLMPENVALIYAPTDLLRTLTTCHEEIHAYQIEREALNKAQTTPHPAEKPERAIAAYFLKEALATWGEFEIQFLEFLGINDPEQRRQKHLLLLQTFGAKREAVYFAGHVFACIAISRLKQSGFNTPNSINYLIDNPPTDMASFIQPETYLKAQNLSLR